MDSVSFIIFTPDGKKFHLTPNWIILGLYLTVMGLIYYPLPYNLNSYVIVGGTFLSLYFIIASYFTYKSLNGKLEGELILEDSTIIINDKAFELKNIYNLDLSVGDYYGKRAFQSRGNFNPSLYQGVNNYITFTDDKNEVYVTYFKLATEHHYLSLSPFINEAVKIKKMSFKVAVDIIGIENVSIES